MRCSHCGTLIEGSNGACPLCGAPLAVQVPVYPHRNARVRSYVVPFTIVYWLVAVAITVVSLGVCLVYSPDRHYWAIVFISFLWLYFTLRHMVLAIENYHYKILVHTVLGLLMLAIIGYVLHREDILVGWVMPIFYAANWILNGALALGSMKRASRYILSLWWQGLLAAVLIVLCFILQIYWLPSVICGSVGLALCLVITLLRPREVWSQIKSALDR